VCDKINHYQRTTFIDHKNLNKNSIGMFAIKSEPRDHFVRSRKLFFVLFYEIAFLACDTIEQLYFLLRGLV
jgi:hypothetical protein